MYTGCFHELGAFSTWGSKVLKQGVLIGFRGLYSIFAWRLHENQYFGCTFKSSIKLEAKLFFGDELSLPT